MKYKQSTINCPHCGHSMHVGLDYSNGDQDFIEECPNCCHDVHLVLHLDQEHRKLALSVLSDDEQVY